MDDRLSSRSVTALRELRMTMLVPSAQTLITSESATTQIFIPGCLKKRSYTHCVHGPMHNRHAKVKQRVQGFETSCQRAEAHEDPVGGAADEAANERRR